MNKSFRVLLCTFAFAAAASAQQPAAHHWALEVHGGAGVIERKDLGPEGDKAYREGLARAIAAGAAVLDKGGKALDAVEAALHVLEDEVVPQRTLGRPEVGLGVGVADQRDEPGLVDARGVDPGARIGRTGSWRGAAGHHGHHEPPPRDATLPVPGGLRGSGNDGALSVFQRGLLLERDEDVDSGFQRARGVRWSGELRRRACRHRTSSPVLELAFPVDGAFSRRPLGNVRAHEGA